MKKVLCICLIALTACSTADKKSINTEIDEYFSSMIPATEPGGAVLILKDSIVVYKGAWGLADLSTKEPMTTSTLMNIGSISKTFVSNAILILRDEGKLSLDDNMLKYFPEFRNKEIGGKVTIGHLLTHTSGLPDNRPVQRDSVFYLTADDAQNWYPVTQTDTLVFEPGTNYEYSNPAFNGLALIIEKVTGQKWQTYVTEKILRPSNMLKSTITDGPHPSQGVAHAYSRIAGAWKEDDYGEETTFCASGNGGVWSSAEELALYEKALRNGTFLSMKTIDESAEIKTFDNWVDSDPPFKGWAWSVDQTPEGYKCINHTGHQGGFAAYYMTIPEKNVLIVVLFNAPYDVYGIRTWMMSLMGRHNWLDK